MIDSFTQIYDQVIYPLDLQLEKDVPDKDYDAAFNALADHFENLYDIVEELQQNVRRAYSKRPSLAQQKKKKLYNNLLQSSAALMREEHPVFISAALDLA